MRRISIAILAAAFVAFAAPARAADAPAPFKAGTASKIITPDGPLWMAGYASRNKPAEGKQHDLWVKALALEDSRGGKVVLLTSDLCGIPRSLEQAVVGEVERRTGLSRERIMLTCSHTHCGPVVNDNLIDMYDMPQEQRGKILGYTKQLRGRMIETILAALKDLKPAKLSVGKGMAGFAMNRREPTPKGVINGRNPEGPVDHDVPVLRVEDADGKLKAVVFGYACHNTTLSFYQWCGDYAGFAQIEIEKKHPGTLAMFWIGCGADANPLPRSKLELCQKYGKELADAVETVLAGKLTPVRGDITARFAEIPLPFDKIPDQSKWAADTLSKQFAVRKRAENYLKLLEGGGKIPKQYPAYPVQVWKLGDQVVWVALGGEVVVDYARRLKKELAGDHAVWITGYANDVMAYIPSDRVLKEGGYEADSSMIYYGMPTKWAPGLEDKIVAAVHKLAKKRE